MHDENKVRDIDIYPNECRLRDMTYSGNIYIDYRYKYPKAVGTAGGDIGGGHSLNSGGGGGTINTAGESLVAAGSTRSNGPWAWHECRSFKIGSLPIMVRSDLCHLKRNGLSRRTMYEHNECPIDPGGYFVVKGTEKVLMMQENMSHNRIIVERDPKKNIQAVVTSTSNENRSRLVVAFGST